MTIQRRLLLRLLGISLVLWALTSVASYFNTRHEVHELFDTQQVRLAQQALTHAEEMAGEQPVRPAAAPDPAFGRRQGDADPDDIPVAVWYRDGRPIWRSGGGARLPFDAAAQGFRRLRLGDEDWIVYYLAARDGRRLVAAGQRAAERDRVVEAQMAAQMIPWALILPVFAVSIWITVAAGFGPLRALTAAIGERSAGDLSPIALARVPHDVRPLVEAMNALLARIEAAIAFEHRLTADVSHELRTPLAALRAQWDAASLARDEATRQRAFEQIGAGIDRLARLSEQLLSLSRLEGTEPGRFEEPIDWHRVVESAVSEVLPLVSARDADIRVDWPARGVEVFELPGDEALMTTLLRNLLDNALRHGRHGGRVTIRIAADALEVADDGPGLPESVRERLGERFVRPAEQATNGSGIGISIVMRIAQLHGLRAAFDQGPRGGLRVRLSR